MINTQLFQGEQIILGPIDFEKDPLVEALWTRDPEYAHALGSEPARPMSPAYIKKQYEAIEKEMDERKNNFHFMIRNKADKRLLGFVRLERIEWTHGSGFLRMAIGMPDDRGKGYGREAIKLVLGYAFGELNLHRLTVSLGDDNPKGMRFFQKAGFVEEVRRRKALQRNGTTYDLVMLGLLAEDWHTSNAN